MERKNNQLKGKDDKFIRDYIESETRKIDKVVEFVEKYFPYGFRHLKNPQTKRSVFEAISVGTYLAISNGKLSSIPSKEKIEELINSSEFKKFTHVANELHKKEKLKSRVEFIENMLKGQC